MWPVPITPASDQAWDEAMDDLAASDPFSPDWPDLPLGDLTSPSTVAASYLAATLPARDADPDGGRTSDSAAPREPSSWRGRASETTS